MPNPDPLHVVVDELSRMTPFRVTVDTRGKSSGVVDHPDPPAVPRTVSRRAKPWRSRRRLRHMPQLGQRLEALEHQLGAALLRRALFRLLSRLQNSVGCGRIPPVSILVSGMPTGRSGPEDGGGGVRSVGMRASTCSQRTGGDGHLSAGHRAPEVEPRFAADALSVTSPSA